MAENPAASSVTNSRAARWTSLLVAVAAATVALAPLMVAGNVAGHDIHYHISWWMDAARQWREGTLYPRWYGGAYHGFGDATFLVYPPISWMLGAALSALFPWTAVPGILAWLALTLGGLAMFRLAREWLEDRQSCWAAALYVVNPYNLLVVYHRAAYAELLAAAVFPLVVLFALRLARPAEKNTEDKVDSGKSARSIVPLALTLAAISLTNVPAAVITSYSVALLLAVQAVRSRSAAPLVRGAFAGALGFALAGVFVVPAAWEQSWVQMRQQLVTGMGPLDNFLFTYTGNPYHHDNFNFLVSGVSCVLLPMVAVAFTGALRAARRAAAPSMEALVPLLGLAIACGGLLWSASAPVWRTLPRIEYVQFPWRGLFVLNAALVFAIVAAAPRDRTWHAWGAGTGVAWLLLGTVILLLTPWDTEGVTEFIATNQAGGDYRTIAAFAPMGARLDNVRNGEAALLPSGTGSIPPDARLTAEPSRTEERLFSVESSAPVKIEVGVFCYPAWRAEVNGRRVELEIKSETGEMIVPVQAGRSRVRVYFARTTDRTAGAAVSLCGIAILMGLVWFERRPGRALDR